MSADSSRPRCALVYGPLVFVLAVLLYPVYWLLTRPAHAGNGVAND